MVLLRACRHRHTLFHTFFPYENPVMKGLMYIGIRGSNAKYETGMKELTSWSCCVPISQRPGAFAIYLEPWHADIFEFLDLKKNTGKDESRARDLFYALWIPDLFMKRVEDNGDWTLMCPSECPGLHEVWGEEFEKLYLK